MFFPPPQKRKGTLMEELASCSKASKADPELILFTSLRLAGNAGSRDAFVHFQLDGGCCQNIVSILVAITTSLSIPWLGGSLTTESEGHDATKFVDRLNFHSAGPNCLFLPSKGPARLGTWGRPPFSPPPILGRPPSSPEWYVPQELGPRSISLACKGDTWRAAADGCCGRPHRGQECPRQSGPTPPAQRQPDLPTTPAPHDPGGPVPRLRE